MNETLWEIEAREHQKENQNLFYIPKIFELFSPGQNDLLRSTIGILLFGPVQLKNGQREPLLHEYYRLYSKKQKASIETVLCRIWQKLPSAYCKAIHFGCTFVTFYNNETKGIQDYILFRVSRGTLSQIYFIEPSGRTYEGWNDFVQSNKLPSCEYIAPNGGVYKLDGSLIKYKSPERKTGFISRIADTACTIGTIGAIAASAVSVAPVTAAIVGISAGVYGVGRSVSNLHDRHTHSESIGLDNMESISDYLTLSTVGLTGLSSFAFAARQRIINSCGRWGTLALKSLNIGTLCVDGGCLAFNIYVIHEKYKAGELTMSDSFHLVLQIYMVYGQVCNTRDIHRILEKTSRSAVASPPKKLTKTQKRNLRKRRAKAAKRNMVAGYGVATVVTENSPNDFNSINAITLCLGVPLVKTLKTFFSREEIIMEYLFKLKELFLYLKEGRINYREIFANLLIHMKNLLLIIAEDIETLKPYFVAAGVAIDRIAAGIIDNGTQRLDESEANIDDVVGDMIARIDDNAANRGNERSARGESDELALNEDPSEAQHDDNDYFMNANDIVEFILEKVRELIGICKVTDNFISNLTVFADVLTYVCDKCGELIERYKLLFALNSETLGPEVAAEALKEFFVGVNGDFLPKYSELEEQFAKCVNQTEDFIFMSESVAGRANAENIETNTPLIEQMSKMVTKYFSLLKPNQDIGLRRTIDILKYVTKFYIREKVVECKKKKSNADKVFETNSKIVGIEKARKLCARIGLTVNEAEVLRQCVGEQLNRTLEIQLLENYSDDHLQVQHDVDKNEQVLDESENSETTNTVLVMLTAVKFFETIQQFDQSIDDRAELFRKVQWFVFDKFCKATENLSCNYRQLDCNIDIIGKAKFKIMLQRLKNCPRKNMHLLKKMSEVISAGDADIISEYFEFYNTHAPDFKNVKFWESLTKEEGMQILIKDCSFGLSDLEYINLANSNCKIKLQRNCTVKKYENSIVLVDENYQIIFCYIQSDKVWFVIMEDKRVNHFD